MFTPNRSRISTGIWILGFVSLLMDISSEMIHSLLPLFLVTSLGASALMTGLIEGLAKATARIGKVFSGVLSDWFGRRKGLALFGYGLGTITKPLFALAQSVGKGIRGAPRDALTADTAPPELRGAAFGLRQSLNTRGAFSGPLIAVGLWSNNFQAVFWVAVIPGAMVVALLAFGLKEPPPKPGAIRQNPVRRAGLARLLASVPCSRRPVSARRF